jgi:hypothetical protein
MIHRASKACLCTTLAGGQAKLGECLYYQPSSATRTDASQCLQGQVSVVALLISWLMGTGCWVPGAGCWQPALPERAYSCCWKTWIRVLIIKGTAQLLDDEYPARQVFLRQSSQSRRLFSPCCMTSPQPILRRHGAEGAFCAALSPPIRSRRGAEEHSMQQNRRPNPTQRRLLPDKHKLRSTAKVRQIAVYFSSEYQQLFALFNARK